MKSTLYVWMLLVGLSTVALGLHTGSDHNDTSLAASKVKTSLNQFSLNLYKELSTAFPEENILISPISIATTLSALSLGARSTTRTQILEGLGFNTSEIQEEEIYEGFRDIIREMSHASDQIQADVGQALFVRENVTLNEKIRAKIFDFFRAYIANAKLERPKIAEKEINDYVERKTRGKITQVVKDLDPDTELAAISYISFQGRWKKPFNPELTKEEDFFVDENTTIKVPMMFGTGWFDTDFDVERSCTVLRLDYNSSASALFVLPEPGKEKQLEEALTSDTLTEWERRIQRGVADVYLPKFEISTSHSLEEPLRNLHITDVFSDSADISGIIETIPLKLSKITHKAVLSIDERGTTASAVPAEEAVPMAMPPKIVFNHPFIMVIQMRGQPLFVAKIGNPKML